MIRKDSSQGIGYSVADVAGTRHVFAAAVPSNGGDLHEQAHDALRTIERLMAEEGMRGSIVQQAVFFRNLEQLAACRKIIGDFYGDDLPATTYVPQPPCGGKLLEIEALGVGRRGDHVYIERQSEQLVVAQHDGIAWAHMAGVYPTEANGPVYGRSLEVFQAAGRQLAAHGFRYDQIVRTWLYLGDIVGPEGPTQRYLELNRARADYYRDLRFGNSHVCAAGSRAVYPASTGIGTGGRDVILSGVALATTRDDVRLVPLENPFQTAAFDYGAHYSPKSPKFARAMAVVVGDSATILVSGTASITASETQHPGDVEGQTWQTLDNIAALISAENLCRHGLPGMGATLDDLVLVRVYVKRQEDYPTVRSVCACRLGELPAIFAVADVCRPDLLVEIEAIALVSSQ
jgi:enamine deaminase RidA (YjgF/YER057c/UK114 family)